MHEDPAPHGSLSRFTGVRKLAGALMLLLAAVLVLNLITLPGWVLVPIALGVLAMLRQADRQLARMRAEVHAARRSLPAARPTYGCNCGGNSGLLIGDAERNKALDLLTQRFGTGHLTRDDFDARSSAVLAARTLGDLAFPLRNLPR